MSGETGGGMKRELARIWRRNSTIGRARGKEGEERYCGKRKQRGREDGKSMKD